MLGIIKGDIRYDYLSKMIKESVISDNLLDLYNIDELLLPLNGINNDYSIKQSNLNLLEIINQNSIKRIYVGNSSKRLEELCNNNSIELIELLKGNYIIENAKLTAKGIIHYLGYDVCDISDYKVLVVGYGNIGYYICEFFDVYGVNYKVLTLNDVENKYLNLSNKQIENKLSGKEYDIIINTIPHNLNWDYKSFAGSKIIDVASNPYGFDVDKICENQINYTILNAIPSKYCPKTAAKILKIALKSN
jgi:hypothetical protein